MESHIDWQIASEANAFLPDSPIKNVGEGMCRKTSWCNRKQSQGIFMQRPSPMVLKVGCNRRQDSATFMGSGHSERFPLKSTEPMALFGAFVYHSAL